MKNWQNQIGYVPQQINLFDDTIKRNIAFGLDDDSINDNYLNEVIKLTHLENLINGLTEGVETIVGERGVKISGGQRQRIAIARALYRDPPVLMFDEATAALDNKTEFDINQAIRELSIKRTIFIITHNLETIKYCDKIIFLKNGEVNSVGTYQELIKGNREFREVTQAGHPTIQPEAVEST